MKIETPRLDSRTFSDLMKILKDLVPHYTPEWTVSDEKDPGVALLKIFSYMIETVITRFNQVPKKNFVAFLDMLGIKLLPAQPARVPITFKLAKGTEKEILIPERTQAAADKTAEHEELPFETEKKLLAIPSQLKKVISLDPFKDAIYEPPPGFLDGVPESQASASYKIVSSPSAGSKNFQLDHVTDLKAEDILSIGDKKREYVVISKISGMIVSIEDKLLHSYPANTSAAKLTKFSVFESKNLQEHGLFIGHKDLFNIKGSAQFSVYISHRGGTEVGDTPLKLSWEYWGEVKGEEGEDWHPFNIIDGTAGLSKEGSVDLIKITEGEIKEKEINGVKSRWIRCMVKEPLPIETSRKLPVLDNITFVVKSSGENLLLDQAFNNDTPLDITKAFTPFGKEPRIFDNFSIASKEAFSKKGAKIEIDIEVDPRGIVGAPAAIEYGNETRKIKVFARGTYGRLVEVQIDPFSHEEPLWTDHGFPANTQIAVKSTPSAVNYKGSGETECISVFATAENGSLVERFYNGIQWQWIDHDNPKDGVNVKFDPMATYKGEIWVFVAGSDGGLHEFSRGPDSLVGRWHDHKKPDNMSIDSSPYASYIGSKKEGAKVLVKGKDKKLYGLDCKIGDPSEDKWSDYGSPTSAGVDSRPFAWIWFHRPPPAGYYARVFVKDSDGRLQEFDTLDKKWNDLGCPDEKSIDSDPHSYILGLESTRITAGQIFVRDSDGRLWGCGIADHKWVSYQSPPNSKLSFSPFVLKIKQNEAEILHIFSASSQNSIVEWVSDKNIWNEYKDPIETALAPALSWEYWNKKGWVVLQGIEDETANLLKKGKITFYLPKDIEETEIAGQKNYWIRARIVGGDYGKESYSLILDLSRSKLARAATISPGVGTASQQLISTKTSIRPPVVKKLTICYSLEIKQYPQQCLTHNNLEYLDQAEANKIEDKFYSPFVQLEDREKTLYLGFEKPFVGGPVKIFFAAKELSFTEDKKPKLDWTYNAKDAWKELSCLDGTEALVKTDILEFIGPSDFYASSRFDNYLYWIKGSLTKGEYEDDSIPLLEGIHPNTTWAIQAGTVKNEILGSSTGESNQTFSFQKVPVLEGEEIRVRETLTEEETQSLIADLGKDSIYEVKDEKGKTTETWVLWKEVPEFFDSAADKRHYTLDRAVGRIQFGDGNNGLIPPLGDDNIKAFSYQTGGGKQGNIKAGEIKTLKSSVAGVDKASNPAAADGGSDTATLDQMLEIGPAMLSHRDKAVTSGDFEWLAKQASRKVAKVRCLPNTNNNNKTEIGWVTVIIVPHSLDDEPVPSLELKKRVQQYLEAHCANTLASLRHVYVKGPSYRKIDVSVDVYVTSIDVASEAEREVRTKLKEFFHPLTGGPEGTGWDFGRDISSSDIYAFLEEIKGVDHIENLRFVSNGTSYKDKVEIERDFLVANGTPTIRIQLVKGEPRSWA